MRRFVVAALMLAIACGQDKADSTAYATAHAQELVTATRALWAKYPGREVPPLAYPAVLQPLHPMRVVASTNGVMIYVYTAYQNVTGVFVRHSPAYAPPRATKPDSDDPDYKPLAPNVYWVTIPR